VPAKKVRTGIKFNLPGFAWDGRVSRYRDLSTGKFVSRQTIIDLLRNVTDNTAARLGELARMAAKGDIPPAVFQRAAMAELKALHLASAALGAGGWDKLTAADYGRVGGILRSEYRYLNRFVYDIAAGKLTPEQAAARAALYAGKGYSQYWAAERTRREEAAVQRGKVLYARWLTVRDNRVCNDCAALEALGWQPAVTFPNPGDGHTACLGNCRCSLEYEERDE